VLLSSVKLAEMERIFKVKNKGLRVRGKCSQCKNNFIDLHQEKKEDLVLKKKDRLDLKDLIKLPINKFFKEISSNSYVTHKKCLDSRNRRSRNLHSHSDESDNELSELLTGIDDLRVGRDYLGAFMHFDTELMQINDNLHFLN